MFNIITFIECTCKFLALAIKYGFFDFRMQYLKNSQIKKNSRYTLASTQFTIRMRNINCLNQFVAELLSLYYVCIFICKRPNKIIAIARFCFCLFRRFAQSNSLCGHGFFTAIKNIAKIA